MDDSDSARAALEHALSVFPDDEVTALHVVDDLEAGYAGEATVSDADEDGPASELFADVRAIADDHDRTVETAVVEGAAAEVILEFAHEERVDGIVMGSQGRSGVSRMLLGSVAEAVTRRSTVPVTVVPQSVRAADGDSV